MTKVESVYKQSERKKKQLIIMHRIFTIFPVIIFFFLDQTQGSVKPHKDVFCAATI